MPKGFTQNFLQGKPIEIQKTVVPNSTSRMYVDMSINKFFNMARVYVNNIPGIKLAPIQKNIKSMMQFFFDF